MRSLQLLVAASVVALSLASVHTQEPLKPGPGVTYPVPMRQVKPDYTDEAKAARIQGAVVVEAVVLAEGTVGDVKVIQSLDTKFGLDQQAVNAAKQWTFKPGTKDGKPVAVVVTIELTFTLK
jgi:TonB family protein